MRNLFGVVFVVSFLALPVAVFVSLTDTSNVPWATICTLTLLVSERLDRRMKGVR